MKTSGTFQTDLKAILLRRDSEAFNHLINGLEDPLKIECFTALRESVLDFLICYICPEKSKHLGDMEFVAQIVYGKYLRVMVEIIT